MAIAIITVHPANKTGVVGGSFSMSMQWTGVWPALPKWYHNDVEIIPDIPHGWVMTAAGGGVPFPNGTGTLTRNGIVAADYGNYYARIYNTAPDTGYAQSNTATLTITKSRLTQIADEIKNDD